MSRADQTDPGQSDPESVAPLLGGEAPEVEVRRSSRRRRTITAYRDAGRIVVLLPQRLSVAEERRVVPEMVAKVLAKEERSRAPAADLALTGRAAELSRRFLAAEGSPMPASVRWVGNQNNRWGSCTPGAGTIRLSDRLRPMPAWVVDYVLMHELAHLVEREHNARFWRLVDALPDAERAKGYLAGWSDALARGVPTGER
ncbi:M48 metallopeptidase family protein [Naumannella cuiyingiana]|uniref:YgjP-like metallopeptidase domain-containing protein n=1 Tax=Naumannella cuiyingiana TaxID=1347891 RepID=A0A7Z0IJQ7_9ACTN|nr:M48 family metallopeptidase [Naumannella cuiyingiana]NYI69768.1 hypothetical protein [Naumannella cuiyingiana]